MDLKLPLELIGPADVNRLMREVKNLDDFFIGAKAKKDKETKTPGLTRLLEQLAEDSQLDLAKTGDRTKLREGLEELLNKAPLLHISFAAEPAPKALERILIWVRDNIDAHALLRVGLQPTIAAGCILRTPNKIFDMSLRSHLEKQEDYLKRLIAGAAGQ